MIATEKALAATLKDIGTALHIIDAGLALGSPKEYNIAKANYFYGKAGENVKEWLVEIDRMIEVNNMADGIRVAVAATHLRDVAAE